MRISDWSSDVCSSDLLRLVRATGLEHRADDPDEAIVDRRVEFGDEIHRLPAGLHEMDRRQIVELPGRNGDQQTIGRSQRVYTEETHGRGRVQNDDVIVVPHFLQSDPEHAERASDRRRPFLDRSEEHTSELQSLMRISYAVFCLKKNKIINT